MSPAGVSAARSRGISLLLCAAGSVLAWLAGADQAGWVRPVALVALAGTGALLATGGAARRTVAALVTAVGVALLFSGALTVLAGGVLVLAGGLIALARSPQWPSMGARYERGTGGPAARYERGSAADGSDGPAGAADQPASAREVWDALDRGEDPTEAADGEEPERGTGPGTADR